MARGNEMNVIESVVEEFPAGDPEDPRNWPLGERVYNSIIPVLCAFVINFTSTSYVGTILAIAAQFNISTELAISGFSFFALGVALGPLIAAPISEIYGRRVIYIYSLPAAMIFIAVCGASQNFGTLAVSRFLTGVMASPAISVGAGSLSDIWDHTREPLGGLFALVFAAFNFIGAELGSVASAYVVSQRDWRWAFWVCLMVAGATFILCLFSKETKKSQILQRRAKRLHLSQPISQHGNAMGLASIMRAVLFRALHMLFTEPMVFFTSLHGAFALALFYAYYIAIPYVMADVYSFSLEHIGLSFLPLVVGSILAVPAYIAIEKTLVEKVKQQSPDRRAPPETRLYCAMLGALLLPITLFWFAWCSRKEVHWIAIMLSGVFFGSAQVLIALSLNIYLIDLYGERTGASAVAGSSMLRYLFAAIFPLFTIQLLENLGIGWGMSLFGFFSVLLLPIPWVFYRWGPQLRAKSRYVSS